jgi:hypothetical protein
MKKIRQKRNPDNTRIKASIKDCAGNTTRLGVRTVVSVVRDR